MSGTEGKRAAVEQANVEALRGGLEAWGQGDLEAAIEVFDPDIEWRNAALFPGLERHYRGHAGVRRFWRDFRDPWKEVSVEPIRFDAAGEDVVVLARFRATGRGGIKVQQEVAHRYTFRDGLVVRFESYGEDHERALMEAGIDPLAGR